jgi:protein-L-isoaspartate O-methyltransferase
MPPSSEEHKVRVRQEFTHQTDAYAANPVVTDQRRLIRLLQAVNAQLGTRILDVATGSGAGATAFAELGWEVMASI